MSIAGIHSLYHITKGGSQKYFEEVIGYLSQYYPEKYFHIISSNNKLSNITRELNNNIIHHQLPSIFLKKYNASIPIFNSIYFLKLDKRYNFLIKHIHSPIFPLSQEISFYNMLIKNGKTIITMHSSYSALKNYMLKKYEKFVRRIIIPYMLIKSEYITVISRYLKNYLIYNYSIPEEKISVIPNSIKVEDFIINIKYKNNEAITLGYVGRLTQGKNIESLLYAFKNIRKYSDVKLLIVGDGPMKKYLMNLVKILKIDPYVIFMGYRTDIPNILSMIDIFCHIHRETGVPTSILEAMAAGKPLIVSNTESMKEIIPEKGGYFVDPNNIKDISDSIIKLTVDMNSRKEMGELNKKTCINNYSLEKNFNIFLELYKKILA